MALNVTCDIVTFWGRKMVENHPLRNVFFKNGAGIVMSYSWSGVS